MRLRADRPVVGVLQTTIASTSPRVLERREVAGVGRAGRPRTPASSRRTPTAGRGRSCPPRGTWCRASAAASSRPCGSSQWSAKPAPPTKPDPSVDHDQLAVGAVVDARQGVPRDRVVEDDAPAGRAELGEVVAPGHERADRVQHQVDAHARAGALGERFQEAAGDLALLEDVGLQVDAVARLRGWPPAPPRSTPRRSSAPRPCSRRGRASRRARPAGAGSRASRAARTGSPSPCRAATARREPAPT